MWLMNKVKVLLFATLRDRAGAKELELELPDGSSVRALKAQLGSRYPNLRTALESVLISINREYAFDEDLVPANCEIALFPPVSGG